MPSKGRMTSFLIRTWLMVVTIVAIMGVIVTVRMQWGLLTLPIVAAIFIMGVIAISINYLFLILRYKIL